MAICYCCHNESGTWQHNGHMYCNDCYHAMRREEREREEAREEAREARERKANATESEKRAGAAKRELKDKMSYFFIAVPFAFYFTMFALGEIFHIPELVSALIILAVIGGVWNDTIKVQCLNCRKKEKGNEKVRRKLQGRGTEAVG